MNIARSNLVFLAVVTLVLGLLAPMHVQASGAAENAADAKMVKMDFGDTVLARMSAFVSNMSECEPPAGWAEIPDTSAASPEVLVRFAVLHNWMHNSAAFVSEGDRVSLEARHVAAAIEEMFGLPFEAHVSVPGDGIVFADGKYSLPADTPKNGPQAVVETVYICNNELFMEGHIADAAADSPRREFRARVGHQTLQGRDTWKLLAYKVSPKPQAPTITAPEVPAVAPEASVTAPIYITTPTPENTTTAAVENTGDAGEEKPANSVESTSATEMTPAPETASASEPETEATPHEAVAPATDDAPVAPVQTDNVTPETSSPATTQETTPAQETASAPEPAAVATPATPNVQEAQPQTRPAGRLVPFTATTDPDFSKILAITVPDSWSHRDAEGVLELTPPDGDAWLAVEAANLGEHNPQEALLLFSGGATLTSYGKNDKAFAFESGSSENGYRKHLIFIDQDANLVCRLTWLAGEQYESAITTILHGIMVNGQPVVE